MVRKVAFCHVRPVLAPTRAQPAERVRSTHFQGATPVASLVFGGSVRGTRSPSLIFLTSSHISRTRDLWGKTGLCTRSTEKTARSISRGDLMISATENTTRRKACRFELISLNTLSDISLVTRNCVGLCILCLQLLIFGNTEPCLPVFTPVCDSSRKEIVDVKPSEKHLACFRTVWRPSFVVHVRPPHLPVLLTLFTYA